MRQWVLDRGTPVYRRLSGCRSFARTVYTLTLTDCSLTDAALAELAMRAQ